MLPSFGQSLGRLPRPLEFVRELEAFEGPILSEYRVRGGTGLYLEKWCARQGSTTRWLYARTEQRPVAEYLSGRLSMLDLLTIPSDGVCFLVDRAGDQTLAVFVAPFVALPTEYLPKPTAYHDETLRPEWDTVPQSFLLGSAWNAKMLADIERRYQNVAGFAYFTQPGTNRPPLPYGILDYTFDRGYPIAGAFQRLRVGVPREQRARSSGVSANSPGVLTMDAPAATASQVAFALNAVPTSLNAYDTLYSWSRIRPKDAAERMPEIDLARQHIHRLCNHLGVEYRALLPHEREDDLISVLAAGKLLAAYWRQLSRILNPREDIEFISVKTETPSNSIPPYLYADDEEEYGDDELR